MGHAVTVAQRRSLNDVRSEWQARLRDNAPLFQSHEARRGELHFLASIYFGYSKWAIGDSSQERLHLFLEDDELVKLTLDAFVGVGDRPDLPSVQEAFDSAAEGAIPFLAWPLLAGLEERPTLVAKSEARLPDDLLRLALTIHALYGRVSPDPEWRKWAMTHRPQLVAATIVAAYKAVLLGKGSLGAWYDLDRDPACAEVARLAVPSLLRTFPTRVRADHLGALTSLLAAALSHCDEDEFCRIIDSKLASKSMGPQQRMHWLCAGLLCRPATYLSSLARELDGGASQRRVRYAGEFLGSGTIGGSDINRHLAQLDHIDAAGLLIRRIGSVWGPFPIRYPAYGTNPGETVVPKLIDVIAKTPDADATALLQDLVQDPALARWHERLQRAARDQRNLRRNTEFRFPSVSAVTEA